MRHLFSKNPDGADRFTVRDSGRRAGVRKRTPSTLILNTLQRPSQCRHVGCKESPNLLSGCRKSPYYAHARSNKKGSRAQNSADLLSPLPNWSRAAAMAALHYRPSTESKSRAVRS